MNLLENFTARLDLLLEASDKEFIAAVAVVQDGQKWLLGLSSASDDRRHKWTAPGGHLKNGETPEEAAVRECYEETGIRVKAVGKAFTLSMKPGIAFVHCRVKSTHQKFKANNEFVALGWFKRQDFAGLKLYKSVIPSIEKAC